MFGEDKPRGHSALELEVDRPDPVGGELVDDGGEPPYPDPPGGGERADVDGADDPSP